MAKKRKNIKGGRESNAKNGEEPKRASRSSARKPRKRLSDSSRDDFQLRHSVEADGLTIVDMNSDGNCLFRALSDQLHGDLGNDHDDVRSEICDFMEDNQDDFKLFLVLDDDDCEEGDDAKDFESYMSNMRQDGEWGGNLELVAAARLYQRKITVFSATLAAFTIDHGESESSGPDLLVSFHDNDHYNSVHSNDAAPKPSVKRKAKSKNKAEPNSTDESENRTEPITRVEDFKTPVKEKSNATVNENSDATVSTADASMSELSVDDKDGADEKQKSTKLPKKSAPCPCGSGLRYKKCCHAKDKHAARVEKGKGEEDKNGECAMKEDSEEQDVTMKGNFRVLQI